MSYEFYLVEKKPPIAWVFLNKPQKKNAMNPPAWKETVPIFHDLESDDCIRAIILASSGEHFSAGLDLATVVLEIPELLDKEQKGGTKKKLLQKIYEFQYGITCIERCRKPVIAAINGYCIGAGLDMAAACDIRLCTEDSVFSLREAAMAIIADIGVLQRLPYIVGQGITREFAFTAKNFDAKRAKEVNLVSEIFSSREDLLKGAEEMAMRIAELSPLAVQGTKDVLNFAIAGDIDVQLKYVAALNSNFLTSNDLFEAFTAFSQKRKPNFAGS